MYVGEVGGPRQVAPMIPPEALAYEVTINALTCQGRHDGRSGEIKFLL